MPTITHLLTHIKKYGVEHRKGLYIFSLMMMFFAFFDGIMTYMIPILITDAGFSNTSMGLIIGTSSLAGAVFDFLTCRIFKRTHYRRMLMIMFALCAFYPLVLFKAHTVALFVLAMVIWGVYFDLRGLSMFDFVARYTEKKENSASFGVVQIFLTIGYLLAPLIAGLFIAETPNFNVFLAAWLFLGIAALFYFALIVNNPKAMRKEPFKPVKTSVFSELKIWFKIGKVIRPVLALTLFLNVIDAIVWTVGPLFAESLKEVHPFAGFLMVAYSLPFLFVGFFVGKVTKKIGKKRTAFVSMLLGSLTLSGMWLNQDPILIILNVFIASTFIATSWPAINGAYADYISETDGLAKDIEGIEDFYYNVGYIVGPIIAGILADTLGDAGTFSAIGAFGVVLAIILLTHTPKKINVAACLRSK